VSSKHQPSDLDRLLTRRQLLHKAAAGATVATVTAIAPRLAFGQAATTADRLGVAFIGAGGRAGSHLQNVHWLKTQANYPVDIVAICDIYRPRRERAQKGYNAPKAYADYRELLADPGVDVVCIATPDHHHAPQAIAALKAGKDVYVEKPLTHWRQFELAKELAATAAKSDRMLQCGTQWLSCSAWSQARQLIKEGRIGQPIQAQTEFFRLGDWGEAGMPVDDPKAEPGPDLNWEAFLGDSPKKPFTVNRYFCWRQYEDYAGGPVTDLYPHVYAPLAYALDVQFPQTVVGTGGIYRYNNGTREVPDTFSLLIEYPQKISVAMIGTQGNPYTTGAGGDPVWAPIIRGWEGTLTFTGGEIVYRPIDEGRNKPERIAVKEGIDEIRFWRNFLDACRSRKRDTLLSPIELAYPVQTALIMGVLSQREKKVARFDAAAEKIVL